MSINETNFTYCNLQIEIASYVFESFAKVLITYILKKNKALTSLNV